MTRSSFAVAPPGVAPAARVPVDIREVEKERIVEAARFAQSVIGFDDANAVPGWEMYVATRNGALALGAYLEDELVAYSYAFPAIDGGRVFLYSNGLAVRPDLQSMGIGLQLKAEQRRVALERGIDLIRWTTSSLAARSLRLYLTKLGARLVGFLPSFVSEFLGDISLDEGLIEWELRTAVPSEDAAPLPPDDALLLTSTMAFRRGPYRILTGVRPVDPAREAACLVELPWDWQRLRGALPSELQAWRAGIAVTTTQLLDAGFEGTDVVVRPAERRAFVQFTRR